MGSVFSKKCKPLGLCLVLICLSYGELLGQSAKSPEERVKSFYSWYMKVINVENGPDHNKTVMRSHLSARLGKWFYSKAGQDLEYDYFIQSQEWSEEWADHITFGKGTTKGTTAVVNLVLGSTDGDSDTPLRISLVKESGVWKIDRVASGSKTAQTTATRRALPNNLVTYVGQYPAKLMKIPSVSSRLKTLLGKSYTDFNESMAVQHDHIGWRLPVGIGVYGTYVQQQRGCACYRPQVQTYTRGDL
jgi:Protein of unknown function (DUF3828)